MERKEYNSMNLTNDADKLACIVYKQYLHMRNDGMSKANAKHFNHNFYTNIACLSKWHPDDIDETINELKRSGLVKKYMDGGFVLLDEFIIYMETRFKNGIIEVTDFISKFIP
jgi:hypothetical protein